VIFTDAPTSAGSGLAESETEFVGTFTFTVTGEQVTDWLALFAQLAPNCVVVEIAGDAQLPPDGARFCRPQPGEPSDPVHVVAPPLEDHETVGDTLPVPDKGDALKLQASVPDGMTENTIGMPALQFVPPPEHCVQETVPMPSVQDKPNCVDAESAGDCQVPLVGCTPTQDDVPCPPGTRQVVAPVEVHVSVVLLPGAPDKGLTLKLQERVCADTTWVAKVCTPGEVGVQDEPQVASLSRSNKMKVAGEPGTIQPAELAPDAPGQEFVKLPLSIYSSPSLTFVEPQLIFELQSPGVGSWSGSTVQVVGSAFIQPVGGPEATVTWHVATSDASSTSSSVTE